MPCPLFHADLSNLAGRLDLFGLIVTAALDPPAVPVSQVT